MRDETITAFLDQLAARVPAPGGGATAALHAAQSAALLAMVARYSDGAKYDADLKMSGAEAEITQLANQFHFDVTTDFGQAEQMLQDQIDKNRARVRVAADLSGEGIEDIQREIAVEKTLGEDALREFEKQAGLITPETVKPTQAAKELGPAPRTLEPVPEV